MFQTTNQLQERDVKVCDQSLWFQSLWQYVVDKKSDHTLRRLRMFTERLVEAAIWQAAVVGLR